MNNDTCYQVMGSGEAMVFIHGVGMAKEIWQPQVECFAKSYQVVTYDMWGHGGSALPAADVTLDDYCQQLAELLKTLAISKAHVIGHSMGGLVALGFALSYPQQVQRLVVLNSVYERTPEQRYGVLERAKVLAESGLSDTVNGTLTRWFGTSPTAEMAEKAKAVRGFLAQADGVGYARTYGLFASSDGVFVGRLGELVMPTLFITGEDDPNSTPWMSQQMAEATPQGQAFIVPQERHMMAYVFTRKN